MFEIPAALLSWFYGLTNSYVVMLALIAAVVMAITTPLTLKSTKGMLEMQRLAPEMRKLQNEHRNDKAKLNEEMMKLYQEHKVNPMASCLPIVAQMPVFLIMFQVLHGLTYKPNGRRAARRRRPVWSGIRERGPGRRSRVHPSLSSRSTRPCTKRCSASTRCMSFGLDLSKSAIDAIGRELRRPPSRTCCWSCCSAACISSSSAWSPLVRRSARPCRRRNRS